MASKDREDASTRYDSLALSSRQGDRHEGCCTLVGGVSGGSQRATGCDRQEGVPCKAPSAWSLGAMLGSPTCSASSDSRSTCTIHLCCDPVLRVVVAFE